MRTALKKYFGYDDFKPLQEEIIRDVLAKRDVLVLMPTGGGKSLCYQLPSIMQNSLTVVISPLISLMKDQVDDLQAIGIPAASLNSTLDYEKTAEIKQRLINGHIRLLYVAPERIVLPDFYYFLRQLEVNLIAIDEAHCISEWGHDFRPEYRNLNLLKESFPDVPIIALTSTAVRQVQNDITTQLKMKDPKVYMASLDRKNLFYEIRPKKDMYRAVLKFIKRHSGDSGIIYCQSKKSVDDMADKLKRDSIRALPYHAGLSKEIREINQEKFIKDDIDVVVATIAFGMGIDKPNVRYVIHCDMPKSIEGYYQETGRAGRDGLRSECVLFFSYADKIKQEFFIKQISNEEHRKITTRKMWDMINYCKTERCRRISLLRYFGESYAEDNCGMCDVCVPGAKEDIAVLDEAIIKIKKGNDTNISKYDSKMFEVLRALRKEIADADGVPPYVVFPDTALKQMAVKYPRTLESFRRISGVGDIKLKKYGERFVEKIKLYCKDNGINCFSSNYEKEYNTKYYREEFNEAV